jgi:hypothetical protein
MHEAGMFRMVLPRSLGGAELDLATYAQAVSALAEGDASAAWCVGQTAGASIAAAYLEPRVAKEIFGEPDSVFHLRLHQRTATVPRRAREGRLEGERRLDLRERQPVVQMARRSLPGDGRERHAAQDARRASSSSAR